MCLPEARISFLQGERKGQENLKRDLVRRIKMLEYSLKQERLKIYRLTHNGEDPENLEDDDKPAFVSDVPIDIGAFIKESEAPVWERAKGTLKQYLEEFGHSENVVSLRNIGIEDSALGNYTINSDSSEQNSGSNDSNILNQAFYGSKDKENLVASDFLKDYYLAKPDNENNQNDNAEDENRDDDDDEDDEGQNDLDDALEALNKYSFLTDEKDDPESDEHEEELSDEESDDENVLLIQNLLAVIESTSPSSTSASIAEAPSSTSAHKEEEEEDDDTDIKNDSFLDESEL
uniref:Striatin N-terminal domain-containing protein n=1 Tax=Panagrolaimus sp. PS1159 TaxID=55785 RepID=A0AC35FUB9_9BILA